MCCCAMWFYTRKKRKEVHIGEDMVNKAVLENLPLPTLEEVGKDLEDEIVLIDPNKKLRPREEVALLRRQENERKRRSNPKRIKFNRDDFKYREGPSPLDRGQVTAYITTRDMEPSSTTPPPDKELLLTYERLDAFKANATSKLKDDNLNELFEDENRVEDLIMAASRQPVSMVYPELEFGELPQIEGVSKDVKRQIMAEKNAKKQGMTHNMPDFLKNFVRAKNRKMVKTQEKVVVPSSRRLENGPSGPGIDDDEGDVLVNV
jgi:hypothetical protein